jgi:UDP-2-acetamido-3-amino-2,3-dideoxy-glucuronate N-acetyltransferase
MTFYAHPLALVETRHIGDGTWIWAYAHILPGAKIGKNGNFAIIRL